ncbi:MAG: SDR family oxidoreductase [Verrucomicrobiia bacterium]
MSINPRIVVITGATKGLGRAMVDEFVRLGYIVSGCGRNKTLVEQLQKRYPAPHCFKTVDVSSDNDVKIWADSVCKTIGTPDLVLNNAAVINRNAPLWKLSAEEFDAVIDINIKGVANVIRHFVPRMIEKGSGIIVNFSSGWGRTTDAEVAPYCATKWAIEGLTQALAQELPSPLAAVPLNPGIINTDMLKSCFGSSANNYPTPEEWAKKAVPFLLSLNRNHNGQQLTVPF